MKKYSIYLMITAVLYIFSSCQEDYGYKVEVPVSDITLALPEQNAEIDLNEMSIDEYTFSWNETIEGGTTLVLSGSDVLLDPVYFKAGEAKSYSIKAELLDQITAEFGIENGKTGTVYWAVKPTDHIGIAALEIRPLNLKRLISRLLLPENQKFVALDSDRPALPVSFTWDTEGEDPATAYSIVFSNNNEMTGEVVTYNVGAVNSAGITNSQLQDVFIKYSNHPFKSMRLYWNIKMTEENEYLSRSSSSIEVDPMMIFKDVRGDEEITYKVAKISYRDGRVQYWLAENLRTKKYPDGSDIEEPNYMFAPLHLYTEEQVKAFGGYYRPNPTMFQKLPAEGWRIPTVTEYRELYEEALAQEGTYNVLRDPVFYNYEPIQSDPKVNKWKLGLVTAGQQQGEAKSITNTTSSYIMATGIGEDTHRAAMLDHFAIWEVWAVGANVRLIYDK